MNRRSGNKTFIGVGLLISVCAALLNNGCYVVTSRHVSKPVDPGQSITLRNEYHREYWYVRHCRLKGLDLDIGVPNSVQRSQVDFFFWVLPIPEQIVYRPDPTLTVKLNLNPMNDHIVLDPWRVFYISTNEIPVRPARIRQGNFSVSPGPLPVNSPLSLTLSYDMPSDPAIPFRLSIEGISTSGQILNVPPITYRREKIIRPEFRLPY